MVMTGGMDIYQLSLSMVTALLGLAYPLLIDKVNAISDKYESRSLSRMFQGEATYVLFHILICISILEIFVFPYLELWLAGRIQSVFFLTIQTITVFALVASMVVLYYLIMTYYDARKLLLHIKQLRYSRNKLSYLHDLMLYASRSERDEDIFNECIYEIGRVLMEFQQERLRRNG